MARIGPNVPRPLAIVNGDVWTMKTPSDRAEAILFDGSKIAKVGSEASILRAAQRSGAHIRDAGGARVIPGLIDSHTHLLHQGILTRRPDLRETKSKRSALAIVRNAARKHRGPGPLIAERWDESRWKEGTWPARDELDAITTRFPLILRRVDGHVAVGNTPAVEALRDELPGVDPESGHLVEDASLHLNRVWPTPLSHCIQALEHAQAAALRLGLTTVHDFVTAQYFRAYQTLHRRGRLKLRVHATPYMESLDALEATGVETGLGDARLRHGGVKAFTDGSLGAHTAALHKPYHDEPEARGQLNYATADLRSNVDRAARAGLQPSLHAIGDAAITQVLDAFARLPAGQRRNLRPRIEHFEVHSRDHVERARELGVVLSMQPNFVGEWNLPGGMYEKRLGSPRFKHLNEFNRIRKAGVALSFGSDCMPLDPWFGLQGAVSAPHASQRLTVNQAIFAYTMGSAYGIRREQDLGSLEPGKRADLVVAEGDWRQKGGVAATKVRATVVNGRLEYGHLPG